MIWMWMMAEAAATAQPPRLLNGEQLITVDDYPQAALQRQEYGLVSVHLQVTAEGKVDGCTVTETSGFELLDRTTCTIIKYRARFAPARNAAGQPTTGDYWMATTYGVEEHQPLSTIPMALGVKTLPPGYAKPAKLQVVFGSDGHVMRCETHESSGDAAADKAICREIGRELIIQPPRSGSAEPAAAVRTYITRLIASGAK